MKKIVAVAGFSILSGCAQFTTSENERDSLQAASEREAGEYIECVKQETLQLLGASRDAVFLVDAAQAECESQLRAFEKAETKLLDTMYMMTEPELEKSVEQLKNRSKTEVAQMLSARRAAPGAPASAPVPVTPGSAPAPVASTPAPGSPAPAPAAAATAPVIMAQPQTQSPRVAPGFQPSYDQRVYMDCMEDQARKYVRLNETAAAIAEVAASRCRSYLNGGNVAALEQEGRAMVMGTVFDLRLNGRP